MREVRLSSLGVALILGWLAPVIPGAKAAAQQTPPSTNEAFVRTFVEDVGAEKYDAAEQLFSEVIRQAFPADKLKAAWQQVLSRAGDFKAIKSVTHEAATGGDLYSVVCEFSQAQVTLAVGVDAQQHIAGFHVTQLAGNGSTAAWTPPEYVKPDSSEDRSVTVGQAPYALSGTLTLPKGPGPFPAAVLVHGSGPNDQDESYGPNKMFKDLALGLASRGIAVLRYTKRTRQYAAQVMHDPAGLTVKQETIDDARAAVALLATMHEIDAAHIFVIGHSLGGYLAPRIASGDNQIAGLILLAGSARPLEDMVIEQIRFEAGAAGGAAAPQAQKAIADAEADKRAIEDPGLKPGTTLRLAGAQIPSEYFLDLRGYDPPKMAASLNIPMLILQGERDIQVRMTDFNLWKAALASHINVTFKSYPAATHLFMPGTGPGNAAEYNTPNHVEADVVTDIAAWIRQQVRHSLAG
jgi:uncharacterized protein